MSTSVPPRRPAGPSPGARWARPASLLLCSVLIGLGLVPAVAQATVSVTRQGNGFFQIDHSIGASTTMRQINATQAEISSTDDIQLLGGGACPTVEQRRLVCTLGTAGQGDLEFSGSAGHDQFYLGLSTHTFRNTILVGRAGNDTLSLMVFLGGLTTSSGATFEGGEGDDILIGGSGDDTFVGSPGADVYSPGPGGYDRVSFAGRSQGVSVTLDGLANDGIPGEGANVQAGFEHITLSDYGDTFVGSPGDVDLTVIGRSGADVITTRGGNDTITTVGGNGDIIDAGAGHNTITTGDGADIITTGAGNDTINSGSGVDRIASGSGDDRITTTGSGADTIDAGPGDDTITTGDGADVINAGPGHDVISSGSNADTVDGGEGDDTIDGGNGADTIDGGLGDDVLIGGQGDDVLRGGPGDDSLVGGPGRDLIDGGEGTADHASYAEKTEGVSLTLDGIANDGTPGEGDNLVGIEDLTGSPHADVIVGNGERNVIHGGWGDDVIDGAGGIDRLRGGRGNDRVIARDGEAIPDDVGCNDGPGDVAVVDAVDWVASDCENVDRAPAPVPGSGGGGAGGAGGGVVGGAGGAGGGAGGVGGAGGAGGAAGSGGSGGGAAKVKALRLAQLVRLPAAKSCRRVRTLKVAVPGAKQLRRLEISVAGKRRATLSSAKKLRSGVTLKGLPAKGSYAVRLVGTTIARSGAPSRKISLTVRYRGCVGGR